MMLDPRQSHLLPTLMLFAAVLIPAAPLATNSAYGDSETSVGNIMQAADCFGELCTETLEFFRIQLSEPIETFAEIVDDQVLGTTTEETATTTEPLKVEVSEEPLKVDTGTTTPEKPLGVEVSDESLEIIEPTEPEEEAPAEPEPENEEAPDPVEDPAPTPAE